MTQPRRAKGQSGYGGRGYSRLGYPQPVLPSVTTVLGNEAKGALIQWSADQTAAYAIAESANLYRMSDTRAFGFLRWYHTRAPKDPLSGDIDPASYHSGVLSDAGELGDSVHEWIEADLFGTPYPDITNRNAKFWECVNAWNDFKSQHTIVPHRVENTVWNEREDSDELGYAGTFDMLVEIDGEMYLIDIKTSRGLYSSTWMQLSALFNAPILLEEGEDGKDTHIRDWQLPIKKLGVIHVRPSDITNKGVYMEPFAKLVEMPGDHSQWFKGFMALRAYAEAAKGWKALLK